MEINWLKAPEGAEFYAFGAFRKMAGSNNGLPMRFSNSCDSAWYQGDVYTLKECQEDEFYQPRPKQWPATDERISAIAQNGGDGLHYDEQREAEEKKKAVREIEARERQINTKYDRIIVGKYGSGKCVVDVYRVLYAFPSGCPDIDHAIKKLLAPGKRGAKDELQDLKEAIQSIEARISYLNETGA
jgi:hypothetical protein